MDKNFLRLTKGPFWVFYRGATRARKGVPSSGGRPRPAARESAFRPLSVPSALARRAG